MDENAEQIVDNAAQAPVDLAYPEAATQIPDMSVIGLFLQADPIVKFVVIGLLFASFWSWAIIIEKYKKLRFVNEESDKFEETFWSEGSLNDLHRTLGSKYNHPMVTVFSAGMEEWKRSLKQKISLGENLKQRVERVMQSTMNRELTILERYMTFLASVGSTAPFVGLFGTVWGIMNSFQAIGMTKNTSLAVVAPGIAEALFATALGLVAAIPAVVAYNKITSDLNRFAGRMEAFVSEFCAILSRQIDEEK
ncbi:MAG: protein TolQ [Pseudomonadota bacterium]|nr:protein TolQ [Pseudomonadota bacterium]